MEKKIRDALAAKFPDHLVKTRPGSFGSKKVQYIEAAHIINRLTEVCEGNWSFTVVSHQRTEEGEIIIHGRLTALGVTKEAFGRASSVSRDGEVIRSLGDCYKAATTQSLTVAARLLGIASYLYSDDLLDESSHQAQCPASASKASRTVSQSNPPVSNHVPYKSHIAQSSIPANRLTQKQLSAIWSIARKANLSSDQIRAMTSDRYSKSPEFLTKAEASSFINTLVEIVDGNRGVA